MKIWSWIKKVFNKSLKLFRRFLKKAIPLILQLILSEVFEFVVKIVSGLNYTILSNDEKRNEAIKQIQDEAYARGIKMSDSVINLILELAVQFLKEQKRSKEK